MYLEEGGYVNQKGVVTGSHNVTKFLLREDHDDEERKKGRKRIKTKESENVS